MGLPSFGPVHFLHLLSLNGYQRSFPHRGNNHYFAMSSYMSIVLQPRTPRADGPLQFSPASLLGGVALARTLDAVNEYFLFIRQRVFGIYSPIASNPEYGLSILYNEELKHCKWLYYELRARVSPEIEVLFDHQSSHSNKERVWKEIYDRMVSRLPTLTGSTALTHTDIFIQIGLLGLSQDQKYPSSTQTTRRLTTVRFLGRMGGSPTSKYMKGGRLRAYPPAMQ